MLSSHLTLPSGAIRPDRDTMDYDVVIVGAGPAGLACAIHLKQLAKDSGQEIRICILEKGSEIGAHLLSGAVLEPKALDELLPGWRKSDGKLPPPPASMTKVTKDHFQLLSRNRAWSLPILKPLRNHGHYIISIGELAKWLGNIAESMGVEIYPGFPAAEILTHPDDPNIIIGVATPDRGINKNGEKTPAFEAGMEIHARQTILAEGCHGSLSQHIITKFDLRANKSPQTYGLGIKEIWEIAPENHRPGHVSHTIGWPLDRKTYGGSWLYHYGENLISIGFVVGLDYENPYLSPFKEMQRFKTHPSIQPILKGGRRISYGARALVEGGYQSLPDLIFPGGLLIGDSAGFLNVAKIKGNHAAIKSGMLAAQALTEMFVKSQDNIKSEEKSGKKAGEQCTSYPDLFKKSWLAKELYKVRNIRPGFHSRIFGIFPAGLWGGIFNAAFQILGGWRLPYTLQHRADHKSLKPAAQCRPISYPKPDGVVSFDRLSSVHLSNTYHAEDQPSHLRLSDPYIPIAQNLPLYAEPAQRYCPAAVYEIIESPDKTTPPKFQINAQNCIHCKSCDIKDPAQNITWTPPQDGGPNYSDM